MVVYADLVILLNFCVDFLLILATDRLCGYPYRMGKVAAAALIGGIYAGGCMLPGFLFLGNWFWRVVSLGVMGIVAFGAGRHTIRRIVVFLLLSFALSGIAIGMNDDHVPNVILGALLVMGLCSFGLRGKFAGQEFVEVILCYGGKKVRLVALCDTGNTLKDPITGACVLVVGADVAKDFIGFSEEELLSPILAMEKGRIPNLRLIPYRAVGQPNGMLLALQMDEVMVDGRKAGRLVAFAPQQIGKADGYQALTGGVV